jgi:hypothetical protein
MLRVVYQAPGVNQSIYGHLLYYFVRVGFLSV